MEALSSLLLSMRIWDSNQWKQCIQMRNESFPGTESMGKPWKNHGKSMGKIPWIPLKTMEHGAGAKFHGFHGEFPMLSMLAWDSKNCKITPHESMESME